MAITTLISGTTNPPIDPRSPQKSAREPNFWPIAAQAVPLRQSRRWLKVRPALTLPPSPYMIRRSAGGAVAQLGERDVRNVEVRGSIPLCSTILFEDQ